MSYNDWYECFDANRVSFTLRIHSAFTLISHSTFHIRLILRCQASSLFFVCSIFFPSKLLLLWLLLSLTARFFSHSLANQKNRSHKQALIGVGICYHLSNRYIAYISTWISKKKIIRFPRISFRISIICTDSRQIKRNGSNYGARDKQANVISQFSLQTICLIVYTVSHCFHTKFLIIIHTLRMKCTGIFAFPCSRNEKSIHNIRCQRCVCAGNHQKC